MEMLEDGWKKLKKNKEIKTEMMMEQIRFFWSHFNFYRISNFDFSRDLYVKCNLHYLGMDSIINLWTLMSF